MKQCPQCKRVYADETLNFCLDDGEWLLNGDADETDSNTAILPKNKLSGEAETRFIDPFSRPTRRDRADPTAFLGNRTGPLLKSAFILAGGLGLAALVYGLYVFYGPGRSASSSTVVRVTPLTTSPTIERSPALSPDGKQVAYVWAGEKGDNYDIYVKIVDAGTPLRLTTNAATEMSPAWSPDGRFIAFLRGMGDSKGFYIISALGGPERKIGDAFAVTWGIGSSTYGWTQAGVPQPQVVDWSPDGKTLAVVDRNSENDPWSIFLLSVESGERRNLTAPPSQTGAEGGDTQVAFSPDGTTIAVGRVSQGLGNIFLVALPDGESTQLTLDNSVIRGFDWTSDGRRLVFASNRGSGGNANLWTVPAAGGEPVPVAGVSENVGEPSVSVHAGRLVFAQATIDFNLWRIGIPDRRGITMRGAVPQPTKFISSTRADAFPQFSPDGQKIAFSSDRSGSNEIWVCDSAGQNAVQLTNVASFAGSPSWSPDGRFVAFDSRASGNMDIYIIRADGGSPRRITSEPSRDIVPSWSRDGRFIYFGSNRTGRFEVWKVSSSGGDAIQVTREGGSLSSESPDSRVLYYMKGGTDPSLWSVSTEGGAETKVFDYIVGRNWWVVERGIYFLATPSVEAEPYTIEFFDFSTGKTTRLGTLAGAVRDFVVSSMTVSPDEQWIVYGQRDQLDFDLMLVENFR